MITKHDITTIFSAAYGKASLADDCDMRQVADLFETVRPQLDIEHPYSAWDFILPEPMKFDNDYALNLLLSLRESYFNTLYSKLLEHLSALYASDEKGALQLWRLIYAEAAVHYRYDLIGLLSHQIRGWKSEDSSPEKYEQLSVYIRENRWVDAMPFYEAIARNTELPDEVRAFSAITMMEIVLYYYPENSQALKHLDQARSLLPDHFITKRAESVYFLRTSEIQKARNGFLQVISLKPGDYMSFNFMGDCFLAEAKYESAEYWYQEAIQKNLLQTESYRRLLFLYGDKSWFKEKEPLMMPLLEKIEKRRDPGNNLFFIEKNLATAGCFTDLVLYDSYRDMGSTWFTAQNYEKSEEWYLKAVALQPDVASALVDLAYVKQSQKLPDKSLACFLMAMEKNPDHFDVHWGLAFYYQDQGDKASALSHFNECLRLRPHWSDWVNNFIGNLFYSLKEYKESEIYYRKSVTTNNHYPIYRQNLAGALEAQADQLDSDSDLTEAERLFLAAVAIEPTADLWNKIGNFYYQRKRWKEAAGCYEKAIILNEASAVFHENRGLAYQNLNELAEAERSYLRALELDKESGRYFNRLGVFYFERKLFEKSVAYYLDALEREPKHPVYLENICLSYEQMGKEQQAEPFYLRLLEAEPENDRVLNLLGVYYYKNQLYEKAIGYYTRAIGIRKDTVYFENLSSVYRDMGSFPDAIRALEESVEVDPHCDTSWNNLGVLYFDQRDYDKAIEYYHKALDLKPDVSLYNENIAFAFEMKQQPELAVQYYKKALEINPENAKVYNEIGSVYFNRGEYATAVGYYRKGVGLEANNGVYLTNLAMALNYSDQKEEAFEVFQKAVKFKDDYYLSWNDLGVLYYENDDYEEAIGCYQKSIALMATNPVIFSNLALAFNAQGKEAEALAVLRHPLLNDQIRKDVADLLRQNIPALFN